MLNKATKDTKILSYDNSQTDLINELEVKLNDRTNKNVTDFVSFLNGWSSPVGSWSAPKAIVDNDRVTLSGMITGGTDNLIMVLPERLWPIKAHSFVVVQGANQVSIQVTNNGQVRLIPTSPQRTNVHLDGITYFIRGGGN